MTSPLESNPPEAMVEIAARYLDAPFDKVLITRVTGDASTRSYFRARAEGSSVIVALYASPFDETERAADRVARLEAINPAARLTFASDPVAYLEATKLFLEAKLPVPPALGCSGKDALILIEDVGDTRLQDWMAGRSQAEIRDAYARAVALIVKIQEATGLALAADTICSHMAFDEPKLRWELGFFFANYFNRYLHMKLDPAVAGALQQDFKSLCSELAARPRVLTHRDYHARNLMMAGDQMFIIDHQDARMGPASYDLASLVNDPYTALEQDVAGEAVELFIEMKAKSSVPLTDVAEFRRELELMTVQRMLKAVGTYASQAAVANNTSYVAYIKPAIERALRAMRSLDRFEATRALLERSQA
jgi:aminoglycoside/choline kinase family phosphotransferase